MYNDHNIEHKPLLKHVYIERGSTKKGKKCLPLSQTGEATGGLEPWSITEMVVQKVSAGICDYTIGPIIPTKDNVTS